MEDYLSVEEAAQALGCHPNTIRNYIKAGQMPGTFKKGHIVLIHPSDIQAVRDKTSKEAG